MLRFVLDLARRIGRSCTVILMDDEALQPHQYRVQPAVMLGVGLASVLVLGGALAALIVFTPALRAPLVGPGADALRGRILEQDARIAAMRDSIAVQYQQLAQLGRLITGEADTSEVSTSPPELPDLSRFDEPGAVAQATPTDNWADHEQPAIRYRFLDAGEEPVSAVRAAEALASLRFPVLPPVDGFLGRGYNAQGGHFGADFVVEEGTTVRAVGDGYVTFADWTHEGGFTIAVQHADGYLSVYKHNDRLLKRIGDRVRSREAVAVSGNTGEITTGPHLHFELWRNGLAQDPRQYLVTSGA
ncbi:MAG: M23 family metallopeptidase [Bacteroidota bacterium]